MSTPVGLYPLFEIQPDKVEEFKAVAKQAVELVKQNEADSALYYIYSYTGNQCFVQVRSPRFCKHVVQAHLLSDAMI